MEIWLILQFLKLHRSMIYSMAQNTLACLSKSLLAYWGCFQGKSVWENHCWLSGVSVSAKSWDTGSQSSLLPNGLILLFYIASDAPVKRNQACGSFLGQMASQTWRSGSDLADMRLDPLQCHITLHLA